MFYCHYPIILVHSDWFFQCFFLPRRGFVCLRRGVAVSNLYPSVSGFSLPLQCGRKYSKSAVSYVVACTSRGSESGNTYENILSIHFRTYIQPFLVTCRCQNTYENILSVHSRTYRAVFREALSAKIRTKTLKSLHLIGISRPAGYIPYDSRVKILRLCQKLVRLSA